MTPTIHNLSDDRDKALAVMEDLLKFMRKFRIGLFARESKHLQIALSDPIGEGPFKLTQGAAPSQRRFVTEWRDFCNVLAIGSHMGEAQPQIISGAADRQVTQRALEILDGLGQVMRHFHSAIIPAPVNGDTMLLLCDHLPDGQWRAYSLIAALDCYGYTERGIRSKAERESRVQ